MIKDPDWPCILQVITITAISCLNYTILLMLLSTDCRNTLASLFFVITVTYHNHVLCPRETSTSSSSTSDIDFPQQQSIWSTVIYTAVSVHPTFYHLLKKYTWFEAGFGRGHWPGIHKCSVPTGYVQGVSL